MTLSTLQFEPSLCGRIRKLTEKLAEEETTLYLFFTLSPDMFCIADSNGYLRKVNAAWTKELGWTKEELLSVPFLELIHPDDVENTKHILEHMEEQDVIRFHNRYRKKGTGEYVVLEWCATAWTNGFTYATARPVPERCLVCPESEERLGWNPRAGGIKNGPES